MAQRKKLKAHGWWNVAMVSLLLLIWAPQVVQDLQERHREAINVAESFYEVRRVSVGNSVVGESIILDVDRTIHREFSGSFVVEVRTFPQRTAYCVGEGSVRYHPEAELPDPITLQWWTFNDECTGPDLPVGDYIVVTHWTIHRDEFGLDDTAVSIESNPFSVSAVSPDQAQRAIEQIQHLEMQIEKLSETN